MRKLFAVFLLLCVFASTAIVRALGDDVVYDNGGGYDYNYDYGNNYGYYEYGSGSDSGSGSWSGMIIVFIVIAFILNSGNKKKIKDQNAPIQSEIDQESLEQLMQYDPDFSFVELESKVRRWALAFEQAWSDGDMSPYKDCIGENLFESYQTQLSMMRQNKEASRTEDMAVMSCYATRWCVDGPYESLDVHLVVKKRTYKVALDNPDKINKGFRDTIYELTYIWQLTRPYLQDKDAQSEITREWVLSRVEKLNQVSYK